MARVVSIGRQDFSKIRKNNNFYVDKTRFIKEWWEADDEVTLIARPRRFGKTLNMSMLEQFFSMEYAGCSDLFEGLFIWQEEKYRNLQGTYPVIALSFSEVKTASFAQTRKAICRIIEDACRKFRFLLETDVLDEKEKKEFNRISADMEDYEASFSLKALSDYLMRYYGKKVIILLDEYDTPMQEAYVGGYWKELAEFTRSLFHSTFKANPYLERAVMTGITRVSKESIFSDLNNLKVAAIISEQYADCFGFTEDEVFCALDEYGLSAKREEVKKWYDGFRFGNISDIYNPWSIINYLDNRKAAAYWANTSSNSLVGKLIQEGSRDIKQDFEGLLADGCLVTEIDEQLVFDQLDDNETAVWSLLLASGYLKIVGTALYEGMDEAEDPKYRLKLTNLEVKQMFRRIVKGWFGRDKTNYNGFVRALLLDDVEGMNHYMNQVALNTFSYFDTGKKPSGEDPERFYHGFVLGLMVELSGRYMLKSNRESGFGRYDVMLEPYDRESNAMIMEFKVQTRKEKMLADTVKAALQQIEDKKYEAVLVEKGFAQEKIKKYGFAFRGKEVLIGTAGEGI